jgi:hypothetical protein
MSNEDVYSSKDSNKNRKIEKRETSLFNALIFLCIFIFIGVYLYHGYVKPSSGNVVEKPVPHTQAVAPVTPPLNHGPDESQPYDMSKPPYEQ